MGLADDIINKNKKKDLADQIISGEYKKKDLANQIISGEYEKKLLSSYSKVNKNNSKKKSHYDLLDDGYQFGDFTRMFLGEAKQGIDNSINTAKRTTATGIDLGINTLKGAASIGDNYAKTVAGTVGKEIDKLALLTGSNDLSKYANKIKTNIATKESPVSNILTKTEEKFDKDSYSNEYIDNLFNGVGYMAGQAALTSVGVPWQATAFISSMGNELTEAFQNNASYSNAFKSGIYSGMTETLTEHIGSGANKLLGMTSLGSNIIDKLVGKIGNKTVKHLTKFGIDVTSEGLEEVISGYGNAIGKKLTYMSDKELKDIYSSEDALNDFVSGALVTAITNGGSSVIENATQKIEQRKIKKQEQKLTSNGIVSEQVNDTSNLNVLPTDSINNSFQNSLNEVNNDTEINNVYQYEKSDNQRIDNLRKSASQMLNNSMESKNLINTFEKIIQDKNYNILLDNALTSETGNFVNAQIKTLPNGETEIKINPNSSRAGEFLIMHEVTHAIETEEIKNLIVDYASKNKEFNESLESLKQTYGTNDVSSEVVADISGQLLGNQEFINSLSMEKPSIFKRIYNSIISLANKITGNSKESLFIKDLRNKWETAYRTQNNNLNETNFSVQTDTNGNKYVNVDTDQNIFDGIKPNEYNKIAKMYINDYLRGATNLSDNDTAIIDKTSANKYTNPGKKQPNFSEKMRLTPELKNVLQVSNKIKNAPPSKPNSKYQSWEYYKAYFKIENNFFEGVVNIGIDSKGNKHFYEVNCIKKTSGISETSPNRPTGFSIDNISQSNGSVKSDTLSNKYSMQENKNNTQGLDNSSFSLNKKAQRYEDLTKTKYIEFFTKDSGDVRVYMIDTNNNLINQIDLWSNTFANKQLGEKLGTYIYNQSDYNTQKVNIGNDINNIGTETDYFMNHRPTESGITADNITNQNVESPMPQDMYSHPEWYFNMNEKYSQESMSVLNKIKGNPNAEITIYRATTGNKINYGDWITLSKTYAEHHNNSQFDGKGNVIEMRVKANDVQYAGDDINEWGYFPKNKANYSQNNNTWQEHLEKNYKATGTRTKMSDIKLRQMAPRATVESSKSRSIELKKQTPIKEVNKQKIENNENAIKRLTQERDAFIKRLQDKIKIKQELIKSKTNQDTKLVAKLNMQISSLNNQIQNRKLDFDRQIERYKSKNEKMNSEEFKIQEQRITKKQEYINQAYEMIENMIDWKDKSKGIKYKVNTMERNLYDIMPKTEADKIYNNYFLPIKDNNSKSEKFIDSYNEHIKKLELSNEESVAVQMLGEYKYNKETLVTGPQVDQYISDHKLDYDKLSNAVEEFRIIYDELIVEVNKILKEQGYPEIEYRKGYFPHFQIETSQGKFSKLAEKLGFKINKNEQTLSTDIAGLTDLLKPGKTYFKNAQHRKGKTTDYNALFGFDNYIRGAADVIFHTEDIQKLRALEHVIRTQYTDSSVQRKLEEIYNNESLDQEQKQKLVDLEYSKINNPLPNLVTELRDYTDNLANKKDIGDRGMEHLLGRETYTIMKNVQSRVSANMVGLNISSALTNFIPITQAWGEVSTKNMAKAIKESIANQLQDDGFVDCSTYLINRTKKADRLYKTKLDDFSAKAGIIFESVDSITSNVIVRGKYYDNIDKGMTQEQAIKNANRFAEQIMAGRSKGDMPTIFNRKNPLVKVFTAFQLEVNNQYGYMFKDLPRNLGDEAKKKLAGAFLKIFIGAWLYNKFSEKVTGRKSAFSPIDIISDSIQTVNGNGSMGDKFTSIFNDLVGELPFIGGFVGGGRLPIQAAIPYDNPINAISSTVSDISNLTDNKKRRAAINNLKKEWSKPFFYGVLPFGGGQLKKSLEGASMYTHNLPGSYTSSGKLRFEAPKDAIGVTKSLIFGQYSSDNAKEYFDKGYMPLTEKQAQEIKDLSVSVKEYRKYREELTKISKIKSDKDSSGNVIKGSSSGKKAYNIMNNDDLSNKAKNYLLSQLSTSDTNETIDTLSKLPKDEEIYKYYYSLTNDNRKQMIEDMKEHDLSAYQLYDYYEIRKEYKETYTSTKAKEFIIDYLVSSNLTQSQKLYLYSKEYSSKDTVNLLNQFKVNADNYLNTIKYVNEMKFQYPGEGYSNYRRQQIYQYINSLNASVMEKALLYKQAGYSISNYKNIMFDYIENLPLSKKEKNNLWKQLY